jgi:hypothetical protein
LAPRNQKMVNFGNPILSATLCVFLLRFCDVINHGVQLNKKEQREFFKSVPGCTGLFKRHRAEYTIGTVSFMAAVSGKVVAAAGFNGGNDHLQATGLFLLTTGASFCTYFISLGDWNLKKVIMRYNSVRPNF